MYSVSAFLARGLSLITVPIFTRVLTPADYGAFDLLTYLAFLGALVLGAALDQAVARFYLDTQDPEAKIRIPSTALIYTLAGIVVIAPLGALASGFLAQTWLNGQVSRDVVLLAFVSMWVRALFVITNNQLRYLFLSRQFAISNVGNVVVTTALSLVFVAVFRWGVFGALLGQVIGQSLFSLVSIYLARASYAFTFDPQILRRMLAYSLPLVPGTVFFLAVDSVDRYLLNDLASLEDVGIYGIGSRVATLVNLVLSGFQAAWFPMVLSSFKSPESGQQFVTVFNYFVFVTAAAVIGLGLFGREILLLLTTEAFSRGFVVVPLLTMSAVLSSIANYFTFGLQIASKSHLRLWLNLFALALNVALNLLLIPRFGVLGAATASALSFLCLAVLGMAISQRLYYVPYQWGRILVAGIVAAVIANLVLLGSFEVSGVGLLIKSGVAIGGILVIQRVLRVRFDRQTVARILKR